MELKRAERLAIIITAVFLLLVVCRHLVSSRPEAAVTVTAAKQTERQALPERSVLQPEGAQTVNLNTATSEELQTLTGIGPTLSQRIIDYRETHGPFARIEDITQVQGIAEKVFSENYDRMTVD